MSRNYSQEVESRSNQGLLPSPRQHMSKGILEFVMTDDICVSPVLHLSKWECVLWFPCSNFHGCVLVI